MNQSSTNQTELLLSELTEKKGVNGMIMKPLSLLHKQTEGMTK